MTFKSKKVFFSYSHKDEELRDLLAAHLSQMKRSGIIETWHDREITAGSTWKNKIDRHLDEADLILLLISANFLASDYCYDIEMKRAMNKQDLGEVQVIPIILKPVDWGDAPFAKLQALPRDAKPVTTWHNSDEAMLSIVQGIRRAVMKEESFNVVPGKSSVLGVEELPPDKWLSRKNKSRIGSFWESLFEDR